jgi:hypothetical protein
MIQAVFAIVMVASAWTALRRNPAYHSSRSTLRTVAVIGLAIAAVIALIIAAVHFAGNRSPAVMAITMALVIIFAVFFLVYVIYTVSTPRAAKLTSTLPPGANLVHFHRRRVYRWTKMLAILVALCGVAGLMLPDDASIIAYTLGAFALFISAILLPIFYWSSRLLDVSLTALQADPWLHWVYSPEQWQQWSQVQVARLQSAPPAVVLKRVWLKLSLAFAGIATGVYILVPGPLLWKSLYLLFILAVLVIIPILSARSGRSAPARLRAKLLRAAPEVYFGRDGVFCDGAFTTWLTGDIFLTAAAIDERPPHSLLFQFEKDVPNPYGPLQAIPIQQAVLIPPGREQDLALLQTHLTERCPIARITLA